MPNEKEKIHFRTQLTQEFARVIDGLDALDLDAKEINLMMAQGADPQDLQAAQTILQNMFQVVAAMESAKEALVALNTKLDQLAPLNPAKALWHIRDLSALGGAVFKQISNVVPLLQQAPVVNGPVSADFAKLQLQCFSAFKELPTLASAPLNLVSTVMTLSQTDLQNIEYLKALSMDDSPLIRQREAAVALQSQMFAATEIMPERTLSQDSVDLPTAEARYSTWTDVVSQDSASIDEDEARPSVAVPISPTAESQSMPLLTVEAWPVDPVTQQHCLAEQRELAAQLQDQQQQLLALRQVSPEHLKSEQQCQFLFKLLDSVALPEQASLLEVLNEVTGHPVDTLVEHMQQQEFAYLSPDFKSAIQLDSHEGPAYLRDCLAQEEQRIQTQASKQYSQQIQAMPAVEQAIVRIQLQQQQNQRQLDSLVKQQAAYDYQQKLAVMSPREALFERHKNASEALISVQAEIAILKRAAASAERLAERQRQQQALEAQKSTLEVDIHASMVADHQPELVKRVLPLLEKHGFEKEKQQLRQGGTTIDRQWTSMIEGRIWQSTKQAAAQQMSVFLEDQATGILSHFNGKNITWPLRALVEELDEGAIVNDTFLARVEKLLQQGSAPNWQQPFAVVKEHIQSIMSAYEASASVLDGMDQQLGKLDDFHAVHVDIFTKDERSLVETAVGRVQDLLFSEPASDHKSMVEAQIGFYAGVSSEAPQDQDIFLSDYVAQVAHFKDEVAELVNECYGEQIKALSAEAEHGRDMDFLIKPRIEPELTALLDAVREQMDRAASETPELFDKTQEILLRVMIHSNRLSDVNVHVDAPSEAETSQLKAQLAYYQALSQDARVPSTVQDAMQATLLVANDHIRQSPWAEAALDLNSWRVGLQGQERTQVRIQAAAQQETQSQGSALAVQATNSQLLNMLNLEMDRMTKGPKAALLNQWDGGAKVKALQKLIGRVEKGEEPVNFLMREAERILASKRLSVLGMPDEPPESASSFAKFKAKLEQTTSLKQDAQRLQSAAAEPSPGQEHGEKIK